ncbi:MAG: hypothetical protein KatS3mg021_1287 [Fimbriimonadales bacterium]|nr:MAG: hypothetical protein KatS3mg021_1287 [Fimbriimonadales bacterium]
MDALKAFGDYGFHAEQRRCPWPPSRGELPEPYSLPASTSSGMPALL